MKAIRAFPKSRILKRRGKRVFLPQEPVEQREPQKVAKRVCQRQALRMDQCSGDHPWVTMLN